MGSSYKEAFIPLPTEDHSQAPNYRPDDPGSHRTFSSGLSIDSGAVSDVGFLNHTDQHILFLGICCDHRKAVIAVNAITIGMQIVGMIVLAVVASYVTKNLDDIEADINDDSTRKGLDEFAKGGGIEATETAIDAYATVSIGLHACGIYGALTFKQWGIITAGCAYAFSLFMGVLSFDIGNILISGLFLYPHYFMLKLMKEGVMSDYNYHKIASCCGDRQM
ncbi:unnamed protein product [Pseudo-nitzschia multistriata]|uniref:Uncharacterized protein n=1 Tax=Pseudo-nitzschia multistriata TaxID=183589 RepID=A0A448Z6F1_9STRA|nr:unnamed protein product [Pseudo-nitzschia multistriata]